MTLTIPDAIAPAVAAACRLHAIELQHSVDDAKDKLASGLAFAQDLDLEFARLNVLALEAGTLLLVAKLVDTQVAAASVNDI